MTIKRGDRIVCTAPCAPHLAADTVYTVEETGQGLAGSLLRLEGVQFTWAPSRFRRVEPVVRDPEPNVLVFDESPVHVRSYSFDAGDERSFDRDEAISIAQRRVRDRGCRQQVRRVRTFDGPKVPLTPPWLIQDI